MGLPIYALTHYSISSTVEFPKTPWTETILPGFLGLGSKALDGEYCNGGGPGFIVGVQGDLKSAPAIIRKSILDTSWQFVSIGSSQVGELRGVSVPSEKAIYTCGTNGLILKSSNGGDNWNVNQTSTMKNFNSIYFFDENHGFAVGDSGIIYYTSNGGLTDIGNNSDNIPEDFSLKQNYPNPFNPGTTIDFVLPFASEVSLRIFDGLGQIVSTLVSSELPAGYHSFTWDASNFSSGIYFYRLTAGPYNETRKLVLIK